MLPCARSYNDIGLFRRHCQRSCPLRAKFACRHARAGEKDVDSGREQPDATRPVRRSEGHGARDTAAWRCRGHIARWPSQTRRQRCAPTGAAPDTLRGAGSTGRAVLSRCTSSSLVHGDRRAPSSGFRRSCARGRCCLTVFVVVAVVRGGGGALRREKPAERWRKVAAHQQEFVTYESSIESSDECA
jgi:hypothetical protein